MSARKLLSLLLVVLASSCSDGEEGTGVPPGIPPLFNAVDPSIVCPEGQVGWDFSTGGNDDDVVRAEASQEVLIDSAKCGDVDHTDKVRAACNGKDDCSSAVPACATDFVIKYKCGRESSQYVVTTPSSKINAVKIVAATYAANTKTPADVTKAVATACDSKQRCQATHGYGLNNNVDPAPGVSKQLVVRYTCGGESTEQSATFNEFVPVDFACPTDVKLSCGVPITIVSAKYAANTKTPADVTKAVAVACTGKRRCLTTYGYALNNNVDAAPNVSKDLVIRYVCGGEPTEQSVTFKELVPVDFTCPLVERVVSYHDTIRIRSVTHTISPPNYEQATVAASMFEKIKAACDGQTSCKFDLPAVAYDFNAGFTQTNMPRLEVQYWCGAEEFPQTRYLAPQNAKVVKGITLQCGLPLTITKAGDADTTAKFQATCNGKRVCEVPRPRSQYDAATRKTVIFDERTYEWTCGDVTLNPLSKAITRSGYDDNGLALECPPFDDGIFNGVRIKSATGGTTYNDVVLDVTRQCFGKDYCVVSSVGTKATIEYTCGNSPLPKTAEWSSSWYGYLLECRPVPKPLPGDTAWNKDGCSPTYLPEWWECGSPGLCRVTKVPGGLGQPTYPQCTKKWIELYYRCGDDPTVLTARGEANEYDRILWVDLVCDAPKTPYVRKECVPKTCSGKQSRDKDLRCVDDASKDVTGYIQAPIVKDWVRNPDGTTAQWGGPTVVTSFKEDTPYQTFGNAYYKTTTISTLPPDTNVAIWAYDQFEPKAGQTGGIVVGFRCVVGEAAIKGAEYPSAYAGLKWVLPGGKGAVMPPVCFQQDGWNDEKTSWYDAARRLHTVDGTTTEFDFRNKYERKKTWLAASFDPQGNHTARYFANAPARPINPIGFFYFPKEEWIDRLSFYGQTTDWYRLAQATFAESKDIELSATASKVDTAEIQLDIMKPDLLPSFAVDFTWALRGDSPTKNPLSGKSLVKNNTATTLAGRNLRATVEMARVNKDANVDIWTANHAVQFPATAILGGNAMQQTDRLTAAITPELRKRLLTVGAPGWMADGNEDDTAFKVRACLDFDGVAHSLGSANLDNQKVKATMDGVEYSLGVTKRCSEPTTLLVHRELFIRPALPVKDAEQAGNVARSSGQGDSAASTGNDTGTQTSCSDQSSTSQACSTVTQNDMDTGGQFNLALIESSTKSSSKQKVSTKEGEVGTNTSLLSFNVFGITATQDVTSGTGAWSVTIPIPPSDLIDAAIAVVKAVKGGPVKTDAKKVKKKKKKKKKKKDEEEEHDGLAVSIGREFFFSLGPLPISIEVGASVGLGLGAEVTIGGDWQSVAAQNEPDYPCLTNDTAKCVEAFTDTPRDFLDANSRCQFVGGRLAEARTSDAVDAISEAIEDSESTEPTFWIGGQAAYRYSDPTCEDLPTKTKACLDGSRTKYFWLYGDVPFAEQSGVPPAGAAQPLLNRDRYDANHGFGSSLGPLLSKVPARAGVLFYAPDPQLFTATADTKKPYVCEFDPAGSYTKEYQSLGLGVEFSAGLSAAACTPSSKIGFCLTVGLDFITAAVAIEGERHKIYVFEPSGKPRVLLGNSSIEGSWQVAVLSGSFGAEMRFFFYDVGWEIAHYDGLRTWEGQLFYFDSPYRQVLTK